MVKARGFVALLVGVVFLLGIAGCASRPSPSSTTASAPTASAIPSAALASLESSGAAVLLGVSVAPSGGVGFSATSPDQRAYNRYGHRVDVGVRGSVHGVDTTFVIPMWYGKATQYAFKGESKSVPLESAVADKSVVWWASPGADVTFHFEDGYFVLDRMEVSQPH
jgi:hypothetical protein